MLKNIIQEATTNWSPNWELFPTACRKSVQEVYRESQSHLLNSRRYLRELGVSQSLDSDCAALLQIQRLMLGEDEKLRHSPIIVCGKDGCGKSTLLSQAKTTTDLPSKVSSLTTIFLPYFHMERTRYPLPALQCPKNCPLRSGGLMVWAGIMLNGSTHLYVFARDTITAVRQRDEVLKPYVCLSICAVDPDFILMDDNARHIELIW
ncbi:NACHT domain-and WD repeat-containing protein 1 [Trichonephila clavipes]|nr:NACHT domain-and WD repeat-containing protein 1 [Trichonephila clavipes]